VRTTAEILLVCLEGVRFSRELDPRTGFPELSIHRQD
jgi:predicted DNA-binding protein with PD1-like motif